MKSLSRVQLFATPWSLEGSSIHGIFQARTLEWVTISFSRRSSRPRDWTRVSRIIGRCFTVWATREDSPWSPLWFTPHDLFDLFLMNVPTHSPELQSHWPPCSLKHVKHATCLGVGSFHLKFYSPNIHLSNSLTSLRSSLKLFSSMKLTLITAIPHSTKAFVTLLTLLYFSPWQCWISIYYIFYSSIFLMVCLPLLEYKLLKIVIKKISLIGG